MLSSMKNFLPWIAIIFLMTISSIYFNASSSCKFEITGKVSVVSNMLNNIDKSHINEILPIENAEIKIERKKCRACRWKKIGETHTLPGGNFRISKALSGKSCESGIKIRSKIKFRSSDLEIRRGGLIDEYGLAPKWYHIGNRSKKQCNKSSGATCNFGNLIFRNNNSLDLNNSIAITHADI